MLPLLQPRNATMKILSECEFCGECFSVDAIQAHRESAHLLESVAPYGTCACGVALDGTNASRLPDGSVKHIQCAPADDNRTAKSGGRSRGNDLYLTPDSFLAVVSKFGAIELDPAGSAQGSSVWPTREYRLDRGEDGLTLPWKAKMGAIVYCNPPYSETRKWIEKADAEHALHMSEIVMLVAARTETIAVQACRAKCICFWKGRITFVDPETKAPPVDAKGKPAASMFPSMVLFWSLREKRIREVFEPYGKVVRWA